MALLDFIKGELIDLIEWTDDSRDVLSYRWPDEDGAIKDGAKLVVRESQVAQFVYLGEFGDQFGPGTHELTTDNIPVLTRLRSWKYGLNSPFKADVYYINTRLFTGNRWGTANPIMLRDHDFGIVRARAYGTFDFRIVNPQLFLKEVAGSDHTFRLEEFAETMRSRVVSSFSDALASSNVPVLDAATRFTELGEALLPLMNPIMLSKYGIEITTFVIENVSVPAEVEKAIDERSSMAAVGNLNEYVKFQMAKGMAAGGGGGGGGGGSMASELAVGFALAKEMMQQSGGILGPGPAEAAGPGPGKPRPAGTIAVTPVQGRLPDLLTPAQVSQALGVEESDVMSIIETGELAAKKIGSAYRIKRTALDAFLAD